MRFRGAEARPRRHAPRRLSTSRNLDTSGSTWAEDVPGELHQVLNDSGVL